MAELDLALLSEPMTGEDCRAEPFAEQYRERAPAQLAPKIAISGRFTPTTSAPTASMRASTR